MTPNSRLQRTVRCAPAAEPERYVARGMNAMLRVPIIVLLVGMSALAHAVEYRCKVEKKVDFENVYSQAQIEKGQFSVLVEEKEVSAFLSRCSFTPSAQKVTCDRSKSTKPCLMKT